MELTWLADTPQSRSRTRALRACPSCQRRKKRCRHLSANSEFARRPSQPPRKSNNVSEGAHRPRQYSPAPLGRARTTRSAGSLAPSFFNPERFVGDLNPEAVIREKLDEPAGRPLRDRIGLWINSSPSENVDARRSKRRGPGVESRSTPFAQPTLDGPSIESVLQQRYGSAMQACEHLPATTREPLTALYFLKVNRIVPILDDDLYLRTQAESSTSVFLERAICLVAAKDHAATPHLRLCANSPLLTSRQFCSDIYKGLVAAMNAELEPDRLTRIRVLALMSLHCEGYEGAEAASLHLCQAIHQAQTVGLHLQRPGRTAADPLTKLFWCLWTLDKMHASLGGRSVLLADRDIGIDKPDLNARQGRGAFEVWLAISDLLAAVISFYRPSAETPSGWEEGFPAFEDIVGEDVQENLDFATLGLLELYYHSVAILSCRQKFAESLDGSKALSIRQGLAAVRIHSIVTSECSDQLPPLPIVPYAVALSMGVSYRQLRSSKLITHFDRAKASLEDCCALLEGLGLDWHSAEAMARLGRTALHQLEGFQPDRSGDALAPSQQQRRPSGSVLVEPSTDHTAQTGPKTSDWSAQAPPSGSPENHDGDPPTHNLAVSSFEPPLADLEPPLHDGFADIDTLFGEFLDLSLPTTFWDPIFLAQENHDQANN